jgi:glycogen(starch) synthase
MRVLHLTTEFPPVIYGGLGTAVGGWVNACAGAGVEVAVRLVEGQLVLGGSTMTYGAPRQRSYTRTRYSPQKSEEGVLFFQCSWSEAIAAGIRVVEDWCPDVVYLHTAMLWAWRHWRRAQSVLAHGRAQQEAITGSDRLIALTRPEEILLQRYYPDAASKIRVVGNRIEDAGAALAAAFSARPKVPTVLYAGRLVKRKGIRELLAAVPEVLQPAPETRLCLPAGPRLCHPPTSQLNGWNPDIFRSETGSTLPVGNHRGDGASLYRG